jgi:hypothetical protein
MNSPMTAPSDQYLPPMLLLFIGSGCAALIYEIVWLQVLQLVIGASAISLAVLLGTFMGGMFAGSLLLTRYVSTSEHPLRVYAKLEGMIGAAGAMLIVLMPMVGRLYTAADGGGPASIVLRAAVSVILLLPPTMLMGATLPAISRYVEATPSGVAWLGFFYGGNILGAVIGCLAAGFYLLRVYDLTTASLTAAALNVIVAIGAFLLSTRAPYVPAAVGAVYDRAYRRHLHRRGTLGPYRAWRRSGLDSTTLTSVRRDDVCVLYHSGGISRRTWHRQRDRIGRRSEHLQCTRHARLGAVLSRVHYRLRHVDGGAATPLLARRSVARIGVV